MCAYIVWEYHPDFDQPVFAGAYETQQLAFAAADAIIAKGNWAKVRRAV